jgi:hypothetical protein
VRHMQIQQNQVRLELRVECDHAARVRRAMHVGVPGLLQQALQQPRVGLLVVHHQDLHGQGRLVGHGYAPFPDTCWSTSARSCRTSNGFVR